MLSHTLLGVLALLGCGYGAIRDGQYFQDLCFRLTGSSICWPSPTVKTNFTDTGRYNPKDVVATRFQGWRDQMFVVTPKLRHGVPFTLGKFDILQRSFPCIQAYPSWDIQQDCTPSVIHNAVDIYLDPFDILWVLDAGVVDTLSMFNRVGSPKVVAFNALTGREVHSIELSNLTCPTSRLQYLLVDYAQPTSNPWVYVSDATTRSILAYDVNKSKGHRVVLPDVVNPAGPRDVLYLALIKRLGRSSKVYFTYLSANKLFSLTGDELRRSGAEGTVVDEGTKPSPLVLIGSVDNNIYFRYRRKPDIYMWNVESTFKENNFIPVQEGEDGRLPTQVVQGYGGMLWVMESNFQDYIRNSTGCLGASVVLHPMARP